MSADSIHESHPYRSTVTQEELKILTLVAIEMDELFQIFSSFQKAVHARAFRLVKSLVLVAIMDSR